MTASPRTLQLLKDAARTHPLPLELLAFIRARAAAIHRTPF